MHYSSVCLLLPIVVLELPFSITWRILLLNLSSFVCENYTNQMTTTLDHVNIIHLFTHIAFRARNISICFIGLYLFEVLKWQTHYLKNMSYIVSCFRCMTNTTAYYWMYIAIISERMNTKQLSSCQWWCWHAFQSIYIYQMLCMCYPHRAQLDSIVDHACTTFL